MNIGFLRFAWVFIIAISVLLVIFSPKKKRSVVRDVPVRSAKRSSPWLIVIVYSSVVLMILAMTLPGIIRNYQRLSDIHQHGERSEATVDKIYRRCGRRACSLYVQYHFSASLPGVGRIVESAGEGYIGRESPDNALFAYAQNTGHVPIAYDPSNVQNSALNFGNSAISGDQARKLISKMKVFGIVVLMILASMAVPIFATSTFGINGRVRRQA